MQPLTCPIPSNVNPLQINGFSFAINLAPDLTYFCQEVNIPEITLGDAMMPTPFVNMPIPGDKLTFGDLQVNFLVDTQMSNYKAVYFWLIALGFPDSRDQFAQFVAANGGGPANANRATTSEATLLVLNNSNEPVCSFAFHGVFPVSLSSITLQSTVDGTQYMSGTAVFRYSSFDIENI